MRYRTTRRWLPRLGVGYVLAGLLAAAAPGFEIFPFFCWFLFPIVPGYLPTYELVVERLAGETVSPPRSVQALKIVRDPMAMDLWLATQSLGRAAEAHDEVGVDRLRRRIEANFICAPSRYALVRVRFDPVERWRSGRVDEQRTLARWSSETGCRSVPWPGR